MDNSFKSLISEHGFERHLRQHFNDLPEGLDYRHAYSEPDDNPFLRIDLDNRQVMSRITQWESGHCEVQTVSFKTGQTLCEEALMFKHLGEFEQRLVELINEVKASQHPH